MKHVIGIAFGLSLCLFGCTEPGEMTEVGAAAGGVMGAGLGAIIGSQTGSAGGGLVIGAAAGAATGAAVGNVLQAQDETIRSQDEAIERQQHTLAANQREIAELKRTRDVPVTRSTLTTREPYRAPVYSSSRIKPDTSPRARLNSSPSNTSPSNTTTKTKSTVRSAPIQEHDIKVVKVTPSKKTTVTKPVIEERDIGATTTTTTTAELVDDTGATVAAIREPMSDTSAAPISDDCKKAAGEIQKAAASKEIADRLFHYRRALRQCPDNAGYHNLLGETYISLNRTVDAEFEFREALKLDPALQVARNNLDSLR